MIWTDVYGILSIKMEGRKMEGKNKYNFFVF